MSEMAFGVVTATLDCVFDKVKRVTEFRSQDEIEVICDRPSDLEDHPYLAIRVRGALGIVLAGRGQPVAHRRDPFEIRSFELCRDPATRIEE